MPITPMMSQELRAFTKVKAGRNLMIQRELPTTDSAKVDETHDTKLLVSRHEAAQRLSISERALDYLVANKRISTRRIGSRVLIAVSELHRFIRQDHPDSLAG
jgi:excisionase family DNA binding protein